MVFPSLSFPRFSFPTFQKDNCSVRRKKKKKNQLIFLFVKCSPYHMGRVIAWRNDIHQDTSPFSRDDSGYQSLESLVTTWHWKRSENGSLGKKSRRVLGKGERRAFTDRTIHFTATTEEESLMENVILWLPNCTCFCWQC